MNYVVFSFDKDEQQAFCDFRDCEGVEQAIEETMTERYYVNGAQALTANELRGLATELDNWSKTDD